jgi:phosphoglycerate dehydrogenase-like enzyme
MTRRVIVVEDDPFTRLISVALDPACSEERRAAFADFMSVDEPDFEGWIARVRDGAASLHPAEVRMVASEEEMRTALRDCDALVVESFRVSAEDLAAAPRLKLVQKFGAIPRNIDVRACTARKVKVLTLRRRANIACAEHVFALMLALARRLDAVRQRRTKEQNAAVGHPLRPFDRRHTPGGNYARIGGTRSLNESTLGIIGLGEIGREVAIRAAAFGMRVLYYQRTPARDGELAAYTPLETLLAESDWIVPQLPASPETRHLIDRAAFARMKRGACLINVANAPLIEREALIEALRSGRLGGLGLDVPYEEPIPEADPLLGFDNVVLTPHMAGSPRFNGLADFHQLITGIARELQT